MKQYRTVNNLMGWLTFIIAATVYCLTIEPTASFWDCPEFITTGYKLEVGHPPGAPFFMLMANLFTQFASDVTTVAKMVNYMSALMSGACILFLFWSITHLVRKLIITDENNITKGQLITIMGSGLVGALVYTFSDTFWFSAVEGEVYAFSSLFTAVVFWLILKWEDVADQPHSDRWIILIAYLTGLSIGVHLLNLLCLPAIVLVYYYKKTPNATAKGSLIALCGSMVLVAAVLYGIVPGIVKVGGWFELLFVNGLGMSFNSGVVVYIILLAAALIWGVYESYTEKNKARMTAVCQAAVYVAAGGALIDDSAPQGDGCALNGDACSLPGVENGVFVGDGNDLQALIAAGEDPDAAYVSTADVSRDPGVRAEFLDAHGIDDTEGWQVHHVKPVSMGGMDVPENMVLIDPEDHQTITNAHAEYYGWHERDGSA